MRFYIRPMPGPLRHSPRSSPTRPAATTGRTSRVPAHSCSAGHPAGCREDQVLNIGVAEAEKPKQVPVELPSEPAARRPRVRRDVITGRTQKILTGYGALYVTVNEDEKGLFEVFAQIGRGGRYTASF